MPFLEKRQNDDKLRITLVSALIHIILIFAFGTAKDSIRTGRNKCPCAMLADADGLFIIGN